MTVTIGLVWHSLRSANLGIDALSRTDIAILDSAARKAGVEAEFVLMGSPVHNPGLAGLERVRLGPSPTPKGLATGGHAYWAAIRKCDLIIDIGEGDSFADIYGTKRFAAQILSKAMVLLAGRPLILAPQTIGPFRNPACRVLATQVMMGCDRVFARDRLSSQYLRELGITANSGEAIDLAFALPYDEAPRLPGAPVRVGLNVSGLLEAGGYTARNQFGLSLDYPAFNRLLAEHFLAQDDTEVWVVPHVLSPGSIEDDIAAGRKLQEEYPRLKLAPAFADSREAKSFISGLDFLVAARMHACIAAFSSGVPVIPVAYSRKFAGLFGTLDYDHILEAQSSSTPEAITFVKDGFARRNALAGDIRTSLADVRKRIENYEDYVASVIARLAEGR